MIIFGFLCGSEGEMTVPLVKPQNGVGWGSAGINKKGMIRGKTMRNIFCGERERISQEMGV